MSINVNFRDESSDESKTLRATEYNQITENIAWLKSEPLRVLATPTRRGVRIFAL